MHMAVLGTTGSGKTTFVARLLKNIKDKNCAQVFVIDLFGEYYKRLREEEDRLDYVKLPYTLFPVCVDDIKDLFKSYGLDVRERSAEEKAFFGRIRKLLKPDLEKIAYKEKSLQDILLDAPADVKGYVKDLLELLSRDFGEESVKNQVEVWQKVSKVVRSNKPLVIRDLSDLVDPKSRLNVVGLIMKEIFLS